MSDLEKTREYLPAKPARANASSTQEVDVRDILETSEALSMGPLALDVALNSRVEPRRARGMVTPPAVARSGHAPRGTSVWTITGLVLLAAAMIVVGIAGRGALAPRAATPVAITGAAAGGSRAPSSDAPRAPASSPAPPATGGVPVVDVASLPRPQVGTVIGAPEHRLWIDGHLTSWKIALRCGLHTVKVGSAGAARVVDVPCGGEVMVAP